MRIQLSTLNHNIVTNKTRSIKYDNIEKFCELLDCEPNDLFKKVK